MARKDPTSRVSITLTVALWVCIGCMVLGLWAFLTGFGGVLAGDIEVLGVKLGKGIATGIVLFVVGGAIFVGILKNLPEGVQPWSVLTRQF